MGARDPLGGGVQEQGEDVVVVQADEGGGDSGDGREDVAETPAPSQDHPPPWLAKALGPATSNFNKASTLPWSAQVLDEACAQSTPFSRGLGTII